MSVFNTNEELKLLVKSSLPPKRLRVIYWGGNSFADRTEDVERTSRVREIEKYASYQDLKEDIDNRLIRDIDNICDDVGPGVQLEDVSQVLDTEFTYPGEGEIKVAQQDKARREVKRDSYLPNKGSAFDRSSASDYMNKSNYPQEGAEEGFGWGEVVKDKRAETCQYEIDLQRKVAMKVAQGIYDDKIKQLYDMGLSEEQIFDVLVEEEAEKI